MSIQQLATQGRDRLHSGLAAVDTALLSHMRDESLRSCFRRIEQTPHRMQHVACIYRKEYIDDSASRTVNATWYTLQKIQDPVVWIAFGRDMNGEGMGRQEDYSPLLPVVLRKVRMIIVVGGDTRMLHQTFRAAAGQVVDADSLEAAVAIASAYPVDHVKVLLSPATDCGLSTSEAGRQFTQLVNEL